MFRRILGFIEKEDNPEALKTMLRLTNVKNPTTLRDDSPSADGFRLNLVHYAIKYKRTEILKVLLEETKCNVILSIRKPPPTEDYEYVIPNRNH